jgi:predicted transglutaminase-like cysteine proteinase
MTVRPGTLFVALAAMAAAPICAAQEAAFPVQSGASAGALKSAPRMATFAFDDAAPLAPAKDFAPWAAQDRQERADDDRLAQCLADKERCETIDLARFHRLLELAATLPAREQLGLVHHYFNKVTWTSEHRDSWASLAQTAAQSRGDCEDIALAKYRALRRLGWTAENLRVVIGWDNEEKDWHAWLAARDGEAVFVLDSILGLQRASAYPHARVVYSISEQGVWDHAPDYVPTNRVDDRTVAGDDVSKRAARLAANGYASNRGNLK